MEDTPYGHEYVTVADGTPQGKGEKRLGHRLEDRGEEVRAKTAITAGHQDPAGTIFKRCRGVVLARCSIIKERLGGGVGHCRSKGPCGRLIDLGFVKRSIALNNLADSSAAI